MTIIMIIIHVILGDKITYAQKDVQKKKGEKIRGQESRVGRSEY
jgi:hypothetical protein